jgi:hypothetical protein
MSVPVVSRSVSLDEALEAKRDGQQRSLFDFLPVAGDDGLKDADREAQAFNDAVAAIAPGAEFSANDLRDTLDLAGVPDSRRGALMRAAVAAGLAELVMVEVRGRRRPFTEPSTGASAHGASINVYRRCYPNREGR